MPPQIIIHSTFTGQTITLFGNIEPGEGTIPDAGPYDVIVKAGSDDVDSLGKLVVARIQSVEGITRTLTCPVVHL